MATFIDKLNTIITYPAIQTNIASVLNTDYGDYADYDVTWTNNINPEDFPTTNSGYWVQTIQKLVRVINETNNTYTWEWQTLGDIALTDTYLSVTGVYKNLERYRLGVKFQSSISESKNMYFYANSFDLPVPRPVLSGVTNVTLVEWTWKEETQSFYPTLSFTNPNYNQGFNGEMLFYLDSTFKYNYLSQVENEETVNAAEFTFDAWEWDKVSDYSRTIEGVRIDVRDDWGTVVTGETTSVILSSGNTIPDYDFNAPSGLTVTGITTNDFTIHWGMGSTSGNYYLYSYISTDGVDFFNLDSSNKLILVNEITGIEMADGGYTFQPDTDYWIRLESFKCGVGLLSETVQFKTLAS